MEVEQFIRERPVPQPKVSRHRLMPWKQQLKELHDNGETLRRLQQFLLANGVKISIAAIRVFMVKHKIYYYSDPGYVKSVLRVQSDGPAR